MEGRLRIAVVNRFAPPDEAITGKAALALARSLQAALPAAEVRLYATTAAYGAAAPGSAGADIPIHRVPGSEGTGGLARLKASLLDGRRLARAAGGWADIVVSLTDPPLLSLWLGAARLRRRFRWAEWAMDLYPEAFAAAGLAHADGPALKALRLLQRFCRPDLWLALGAQQRDAIRAWRRAPATPAWLLPCGIVPAPGPLGPPPAWKAAAGGRVVLAYAGNVGEAHGAEALARLVAMADPERFAFVLALYGAHAAPLRARLAGLPHVTLAQRLGHDELRHADVHIASLRPEWSHVCVPSKAVTSLCLGRPVLFMGAPESDIWHLAHGAGWCVAARPGGDADPEGLARALAEIADPGTLARRTATAHLRAEALRRLETDSLARLVAWCAAAEPAPAAGRLREAAA